MIEDIFNGITIYQDDNLPKYQIDAFLLADFADSVTKTSSLTLDLGSGTGAVGLQYSLKNQGQIHLIEIQSALHELEKKSIEKNNLGSRVKAVLSDINDLTDIYGINSVDVIITNPPYFDTQSFKKHSEDDAFAIARHEIKINLKSLITTAKKLLKSKGKFYMIHRTDRLAEIMNELIGNGFGIEKMQFVYHDKNSKSELFLIKAIKQGSIKDIKVEKPIFINEGTNY
ncbi:MAG: methyltransferase [Lactobacillaceae bacterium]|jgi:putative endonuclease|nr:methyltransferase [Lactobacillaceae bacterium]